MAGAFDPAAFDSAAFDTDEEGAVVVPVPPSGDGAVAGLGRTTRGGPWRSVVPINQRPKPTIPPTPALLTGSLTLGRPLVSGRAVQGNAAVVTITLGGSSRRGGVWHFDSVKADNDVLLLAF